VYLVYSLNISLYLDKIDVFCKNEIEHDCHFLLKMVFKVKPGSALNDMYNSDGVWVTAVRVASTTASTLSRESFSGVLYGN
jgi:hypothetical protein